LDDRHGHGLVVLGYIICTASLSGITTSSHGIASRLVMLTERIQVAGTYNAVEGESSATGGSV
jgi:hypothetical protein